MARHLERGPVDVADVFERCPECGTVVVQLSTHRCPSGEGGGQLTRERREALAERDGRDEDDSVGVFRRSHGDAYAYHELEDGQPVCGCAGNTKAERVTVISRGEAKSRGKSPCGSCRRIQQRRHRASPGE